MKTVKEISEITGISIRTLHYYDEIGLLLPTEKSEAGYRYYDDKALEILQQILFFREFDIPLKEIKSVIKDSTLNKNQILKMQKNMLTAKKERIEKLIIHIDDILKGENYMDFTVFNKTEIEEMFETMFHNMPENIIQKAIEEFGSIEKWKKHYIQTLSSEDMQKRYVKVVEWYGGKEAFQYAANHPISKEISKSYQNREKAILQKLINKKDCDINSFEIKEIIGEYAFVMKQMCQLKQEKGVMMGLAKYYRNDKIKPMIDEKYGKGASEYFSEAIEAFYKKS